MQTRNISMLAERSYEVASENKDFPGITGEVRKIIYAAVPVDGDVETCLQNRKNILKVRETFWQTRTHKNLCSEERETEAEIAVWRLPKLDEMFQTAWIQKDALMECNCPMKRNDKVTCMTAEGIQALR
ncbi:hypothetical protein M514_06195 [Trichuris suis]|uniref:Uncharacterized protein n=1 Tax=Trichuris suis TaxID=68888 RepID=A0A085NFH3_9BILA|nr:hypothetical protein M513_06195 [Trichuris suis]KFD68219.1 hypothetical protein M514_06195 [Trichuris suis]